MRRWRCDNYRGDGDRQEIYDASSKLLQKLVQTTISGRCPELSATIGRRSLASAVRETGVYLYNGGPIKGPIKHLNTIVLWCKGGFMGVLHWSPMMPRDVSVSESCTSDRCCFSSLGSEQWRNLQRFKLLGKILIFQPFKILKKVFNF